MLYRYSLIICFVPTYDPKYRCEQLFTAKIERILPKNAGALKVLNNNQIQARFSVNI